MPHTMLLKMRETHDGSEDGLTLKTFEKDKTYDVAISLAQVFLNEKWAEPAKASDDDDELSENSINAMTKPKLTALIKEHDLDIDDSQKVADLKVALIAALIDDESED